MHYQPDKTVIRQCCIVAVGKVALNYPPSLGLWHNFGDATLIENSRQLYSARLILVLHTSTLPITMVRLPVPPSAISAAFCRKIFCRGAMN